MVKLTLMKNTTKLILGGLILSGIGVGASLNCGNCNKDIAEYTPRENSISEKKTTSMQALELFAEMRRNVSTGRMEASDFSNAWQAVKNFSSSSRGTIMTLKDEGPDNVGGRTRAILVDKNDINTVYAGSVSGGLFKSTNRGNTWSRVDAFNTVLSVSTIAQTNNGTIYVGTGHWAESSIDNAGSGGHRADGIYYTTDNGASFTKLVTPTSPIPWGNSHVNDIIAHPTEQDVIYVGGSVPIRITKVTNKTVFETEAGINTFVGDLKMSKDGSVFVAAVGNRTFVKEGSGNFTDVSGVGAGQISSSGMTRIEYAISQEKNSTGKYSIYASTVKSGGRLGGIWASHDNGQTWSEVIPETPSGVAAPTVLTTDPFANGLQFQGNYNNIITSVPGFPKTFIVGGINIHRWAESSTAAPFGQMSQVSSSQVPQTSNFYSHADHHEFHWDNTNRLYTGNDGGIGISDNATQQNIRYYPANRGYNVTQFYGIGFSKFGDLIGGAQDNGTQYKDVNNPGTSPQEFRRTLGGDGFDAEISHLNPNILFSSIYTGANYRSATKAAGSTFTSSEIDALPDNLKPFFNVNRLYENSNDLNSTDSVYYYASENKAAGEVITVTSKNLDVKFPHVLTAPLTVIIDTAVDPLGDTTFSFTYRDTLKIQDRTQSLFALGLTSTGGVWVTRGALRFGSTPIWWKVMNSVTGRVTELEFSKDGDILYVATSGGEVYRIKGFNNVYFNDEANDTINGINGHDSTSYNYADIRSGVSQLQVETIFSGSQYVAGMGVDPKNPEHLVIALGGYSAGSNIRKSTTAASTTVTSSFISIRGNLPAMPVYDAVIDMNDPNIIIAGTEFGAWISQNGGSTWTAQNDEMGAVPVYDVRQQYRGFDECTNSGMIYLGTHGRGIWSTSDFLSIDEKMKENKIEVSAINLYPNPVDNFTNVEFELSKVTDVTISVFSLTGQMISRETLTNRQPGNLKHRVNASKLPKGVYFVTVQADGMKFQGVKFIKQ
jgi:hypothetical protein